MLFSKLARQTAMRVNTNKALKLSLVSLTFLSLAQIGAAESDTTCETSSTPERVSAGDKVPPFQDTLIGKLVNLSAITKEIEVFIST